MTSGAGGVGPTQIRPDKSDPSANEAGEGKYAHYVETYHQTSNIEVHQQGSKIAGVFGGWAVCSIRKRFLFAT